MVGCPGTKPLSAEELIVQLYLSPGKGELLLATGAWLVFRTQGQADPLIGPFELRVHTELGILLRPDLSTDKVLRLHRRVVFGQVERHLLHEPFEWFAL